MMLFILKKMVSRFFFPLSLVLELLLLGIFLKKRGTKVILAGAFSGYRLFPAGRDLGQYGKGIL